MASWQAPFEPDAILGEPDKSRWAHAVHCALLPIGGALGSVLHFCGNRWDDNNHHEGLVNHATLIDYQTHNATRPGAPSGPGGLPATTLLDLFCCGHSLLADGRLIVGGGTSMMQTPTSTGPHSGHWGGLRESWIFDVDADPTWVPIAQMNYSPAEFTNGPNLGGGRWYPSLLTLGDGSVIAMSGHPRLYPSSDFINGTPIDEYIGQTLPGYTMLPWDDERHNNNTPEVYSLAANTWTPAPPLGEGLDSSYAVFYPRLHVLPSGKLLIVQPLYSDILGENEDNPQLMQQSLVYDVPSRTVTAYFPGPQNLDQLYLIRDTRAQFTSSVLLPLLPENSFTPRVLLCGAEQPALATIATGSESSASWQPTASRKMTGPRAHCNATLLPTGEVFVNGGMKDPGESGAGTDATNGQMVPEIFDPATAAWRALTGTPATVPRGYHSSALLMADGRVWTAGSEVNNVFGADSAEFRVEIFEPDYIAAAGRVTISDAPPTVAYGQSFDVSYQPAAATISRVAVTRVGSSTHACNCDQRYVGLDFSAAGSGTVTVTAPSDGNLAPPGYYLLWLIDENGNPCQQASFLRICTEQVYAVMNRSTFSIYEVNPHGSVTVPNAFSVVFDGFTANEVAGEPPFDVSFSVGGMSAQQSQSTTSWPNPAFSVNGAPRAIQRIAYSFDLTFTGDTAFQGIPKPDGSRPVTVTIHSRHYSCGGVITLVMEPNPFMLKGNTWYLNTDTRVFQMTPDKAGNYVPGLTFTTANGFIGSLIHYLNNNPATADTFFTGLPSDEDPSWLSLQPTVDGTPHGTPVYNFALARVHLDSEAGSPDADTVRVLFRACRTATPSLVYDTNSLYRRNVIAMTDPYTNTATTDSIPLLGIDTDNSITAFPFFAKERVTPAKDMKTQTDPDNLLRLPATPGGETTQFFGCWLDINQPDDGQFPQYPGTKTDFSGEPKQNLKAIQTFLVDGHYCLVAEVYYKLDSSAPDLVHAGDTPASTDKLSQRNLSFEPSGNPGSAATRTVQHAFDIQPLARSMRIDSAAARIPGTNALIIWWQDVPRTASATIFLPQLAVRDLIALIPPSYAQTLEVLDEHTIRCTIGDMTFIPLPTDYSRLPALLTIELPPGVHDGQSFSLLAQQISSDVPEVAAGRGQVSQPLVVTGQRRRGPRQRDRAASAAGGRSPAGAVSPPPGRSCRVLGSFTLKMPVKKEAAILPEEMNKYAILSNSLAQTPETDRWWPVLERIVRLSGHKISQLGGDPHAIVPSPYGAGGAGRRRRHCGCWLCWWWRWL